jgi:hypothetical protein
LLTPTLSEAEKFIVVTFFITEEPFAGEVIETVGGFVSFGLPTLTVI